MENWKVFRVPMPHCIYRYGVKWTAKDSTGQEWSGTKMFKEKSEAELFASGADGKSLEFINSYDGGMK